MTISTMYENKNSRKKTSIPFQFIKRTPSSTHRWNLRPTRTEVQGVYIVYYNEGNVVPSLVRNYTKIGLKSKRIQDLIHLFPYRGQIIKSGLRIFYSRLVLQTFMLIRFIFFGSPVSIVCKINTLNLGMTSLTHRQCHEELRNINLESSGSVSTVRPRHVHRND